MKRIFSFIISLVMMFSFITIVPAVEVQAASTRAAVFTSRLAAPLRNNPYYYNSAYNPFYPNYAMPNCTAYAFGRAYEILGTKPRLSTGMAGKWWYDNKSYGWYSSGSEPKLGAIACWDNWDQYTGHVAVVEKIEGSRVTLSESHYKGANFTTTGMNKNSSDYLTSMRFLGYIYIGDFSSEPPKPADTEAPKISKTYVEDWNVGSMGFIACVSFSDNVGIDNNSVGFNIWSEANGQDDMK